MVYESSLEKSRGAKALSPCTCMCKRVPHYRMNLPFFFFRRLLPLWRLCKWNEWINEWMWFHEIWNFTKFYFNNFTLNILQNATGWHTKYCNLAIILILSYKRLNVIDAVASAAENKTFCFRNGPHTICQCQLFIILSSFYFILCLHFLMFINMWYVIGLHYITFSEALKCAGRQFKILP